jgi:hypothetical protein
MDFVIIVGKLLSQKLKFGRVYFDMAEGFEKWQQKAI